MEAIIKELNGYKEIPSYPEYLISQDGEIISKDKKVLGRWGNTRVRKARVIQSHIGRSGYNQTRIYRDGKVFNCYNHRLVAISYLGVPSNALLVVNHIDGNKLNNHFSNLEWCTVSENVKHGYKLGRKHPAPNKGKFGINHNRSKAVIQKLDGIIIGEFESMHIASRFLNITPIAISRVCRKQRTHTKGFVFEFKNI